MTRPEFIDLQSATAGWDATVNDNYRVLRESIPFPEYADLATLNSTRPPAQNEGCAAAVLSPSWIPYWCDGTAWVVWPSQLVPHATTHYSGGSDPLPHQNLPGAGTNDHAAIDSHIADLTNPHATTAAQVGADPAGTAAAAVIVHEAAGDPHPGYQLESEKGVANGYAELDGTGKVPASQLPPFTGLSFQGFWDANTNTPPLASGVGTEGHFYIVSVAGTTNLDGITDWAVGDWAVFYNSAWRKLDNTDAVTSVNGQTGVVVLNAGDVGAAPATHAANHSQGGSDPVSVENLACGGALDQIPYCDGAGGLSLDMVRLPEFFYTDQITPAPTSGVAGGVFVNFHTDTTPALVGGDYIVEFAYQWSLDDVTDDFVGRVRVGGIEIINPGDPGRSVHQQEPKDAGGVGTGGTDQVHLASGFRKITLPAGAASVVMDFGKDPGATAATTVTVYAFFLKLYRVP